MNRRALNCGVASVLAGVVVGMGTNYLPAAKCTKVGNACFTWTAGPGNPYPGYCCQMGGAHGTYRPAAEGERKNVIPNDTNGENCGDLYDTIIMEGEEWCNNKIASLSCGGARNTGNCTGTL